MGSLGSNTDTKTRGKDEGCESLPDSAAVRVCSQVSRPRPSGGPLCPLTLLPPLQDRPGRPPARPELLLPLGPLCPPLPAPVRTPPPVPSPPGQCSTQCRGGESGGPSTGSCPCSSGGYR